MLGNIDVGGQRAGSERSQIDPRYPMFTRPKVLGHSRSRVQFDAMPLSIVER
jgi:hypothetical protein